MNVRKEIENLERKKGEDRRTRERAILSRIYLEDGRDKR